MYFTLTVYVISRREGESLHRVRPVYVWMGLVMVLTLMAGLILSGCAAWQQKDLAGKTVYLQIESVSDNTLTCCTGTLEAVGTVPQSQKQAVRYVFIPAQETMSLSLESAVDEQGRTVRIQTLAPQMFLAVTFGAGNVVSYAVLRTDIVTQQQAEQLYALAQTEDENRQQDRLGTAAQTIRTDTTDTGCAYDSSAQDENALRIENAATVSLKKFTVQKTGDASEDAANVLYTGCNAGILATDGVTVTLSDGTIQSDGTGACGILGIGMGTSVTLSNLTVQTQAEASCAVGVYEAALQIDGGIYESGGADAPAVYAAGDAVIENASLMSAQSQVLRIDAGNNVQVFDTSLQSGDGISAVSFYAQHTDDTQAGDEQAKSTGTLTMIGGSLRAGGGAYFCVNDVQAQIGLENVDMQGADALLGLTGQNSSCTLHAATQKLQGDIELEPQTQVCIELTDFSVWEGAVDAHAQDASVRLSMEQTCTWSLTADSYLDEFDGDLSCVQTNGYTLYVAGKAVK